jgi:hypothetical protein
MNRAFTFDSIPLRFSRAGRPYVPQGESSAMLVAGTPEGAV